MKLQLRFMLLLLLVFGAVGSLLVVQRSFDYERSQQILTSELNQRRSLFGAGVEAEGKTFQTFSEDYSFWDEMVNFVANGDRAFAANNLDTGLDTFGADTAWVFRPDGTLLYTAKSADSTEDLSIKLPKEFFDKVDNQKFVRFYLKEPAGVMELRAATIVPGNDPSHATKAKGYWIVGRFLHAEYLTALGESSQSDVRLVDANVADSIAKDTASFSLPLDDWQGNTVARLGSTIKVTVIKELDDLYMREILLLLGLSALISTIISVAIWLLILRPIRRISDAITFQHPKQLKSVVNSGGQLGSLAHVVQEFFAQKTVIEEERIKQADLEKLNKDKTAFLSVAAHELKSPIAIIKLLAEDLPKQVPAGNQLGVSKQLDIIVHQANKMSTLINDLRLAGEGREATVYETTKFAFDPFLKKEVTEMAFITNQRLELEGETNALVTADVERLAQVISNLIRNAAKYSPQADRIIIRSSVADGRAIVEFKDFGVGIAVEDQQRIFERFYRAPSVEKSFQGLGLGLSISQGIIEHFGGKIWLKSTLGQGTSFFISLPITGTSNKTESIETV